MFLPVHISDGSLEERVAHWLKINPTGKIIENLRWLGLFSDDPISPKAKTVTEVLVNLVNDKLRFPAGARDMVIIAHEIEAAFPDGKKERVTSTLVEYGEPGGVTAMAKTVGLPAGIATRLILTGMLPVTGCQIPTHPAIHTKVLDELEAAGLTFKETVTQLE